MQPILKTCAVQVKATAADDPSLKDGQFTALASVFNNVDSVGDVVMPGAFTEDLKAWSASGDPIPLLWGHQMADPDMNIGHVLTASETPAGLQITAQLDLDNPKAAQVYRLLKGKRVSKMSFAYDVIDGAPAERDGKSVYELRELKLHEVSVVQVPANPAARIQEVKEAAERRKNELADNGSTPLEPSSKAELVALFERFLDQHAAMITTAADSAPSKTDATPSGVQLVINAPSHGSAAEMGEAVAAAIYRHLGNTTTSTSNDGKANPHTPATAEEPHGVKTDTPAKNGPASDRLRAGLTDLSAEFLTD